MRTHFGNCEKVEQRSEINQKINWKHWQDENKKKIALRGSQKNLRRIKKVMSKKILPTLPKNVL